LADLEELRQKLTRYYVDRGYINSGALLEFDLTANDVLVCTIVEGRLSAVRLRGLERLHEDYVVGRLARDGDGPLNVDTLRERFQLLLSDPLFTRMNSRLMPGEELGSAILDIDIMRARPYQLTLYTNNYRPPSIGSEGVGLSGWVRNLTGRGDVLEASVEDSAHFDSGLRASIGWRMPLGRSTELSLKYDRGRSSVVEEPLTPLGIISILESRDVGVAQTFVETLRDKFTVGLNHVDRENRTWLLGVPFSFVPGEPSGTTKASGWRFWQEYTHRSESAVLALRSTFSFVHDNLPDVPDLPPTTTAEPDRQYRFWLVQAQYARQVLDNGAQLILRGTLQRTTDRLLTLDGMPIGGVNSVRGYRENELIRDNAKTFNIEFEYPLTFRAVDGLHLSVIPFYDYGQGDSKDGPSSTLSSMGLATRARWRNWTFYLALAKRLVYPGTVNNGKSDWQDKGIHFSLSYDGF
jgi:hemolysin activation/secretion protein